jgi:protein-tyrosine phosphatase
MTITDRLQALAGTYNLRDTGGYPAATGETRWGKLYRSDALHRLTDESREQFAALGIRLVVDLRDEAELASSPSRLDGLGLTVVHTPIFAGAAPTAALADVTLEGLYRSMITDYGDNLAAAVRLIARSGDEPVLVHCTAGKDRTGLVVALALRGAGTSREAVIADYAETEENLRGEWVDTMLERMTAGGYPGGRALRQIVSASPPELITAILDRIDEEYGSAAAYLLAHGLDEHDLELLKAVLVAPAAIEDEIRPIPSSETPSNEAPEENRA